MIGPLIGKAFLKLAGWRWEGGIPDKHHFVLIAAPHTSNWDLAYMLAFSWIVGVKLSWMGKHTLFKGLKGKALLAMGGIPVDRRAANGLVGQMVDVFAARDELILAIPPEGTRGHVERWKSGFYYIAKGAGVPIVMGYLDYENKIGGFGPTLWPSDDVVADMDQFRAFYADKRGCFPDKVGAVHLREETPPDEAAEQKQAAQQ